MLFYLSYILSISPELLNKCKIFNIKDSDCINSSFVPSSEYNNYLKSFNMPVIKDDYCNKNKCMAVVSNENILNKQQPAMVNTMTLTSTMTSTVMISVPKPENVVNSPPPPPPASAASNNNNVCEVNTKESKDEKDCEPEKTEVKQTRNKKRKREIEESEATHDTKNKDKENITTVIREIPTTVTVEVPLTLFREHTTTSISKVPIINYSLTTFTESITSIETVTSTKTTTVTSEIYKTSTVTTEIQKTATITESKSPEKENKPTKDLESEEEVPKKRKKNQDFKFPGYFKELEEEREMRQKEDREMRPREDREMRQKEDREMRQREEPPVNNATSTVYVTVSTPPKAEISTVTVSVPASSSQPIMSTVTVSVPAQQPPTQPAPQPAPQPALQPAPQSVARPQPQPPTYAPTYTPTYVHQPPSTSNVSKLDQVASVLPPKLKEDCDEDIIPLLKELLKTSLATKKKEVRPKKATRRIYRTVYAKKRKRKCVPKKVCEEKKCLPTDYDRLCEDDSEM